MVLDVTSYPQQSMQSGCTKVTFLTQYIDKRAPTVSVKVTSIMQTRPAKQQKTNTRCGAIKGKIQLKKYAGVDYDSISMGQHQQLYKLWKKTGLIKGKKTPESGRALEARVASFMQKQTIVAMRAYSR